ncbi:MAG TPA: hypothetical protein PKH29_03060 [Oscillospiraceae bacterium]|nr:hypothetical protein [Oscillospiraceae bacterium]
MAVWRLQTKPGTGKSIARYCIDNKIAALGWSLTEIPEEERQCIKTFDDYLVCAKKAAYKQFKALTRFHSYQKEGDLIWVRDEGKYYLGRVGKHTKWKFNNEAVKIDAANQLSDIDWYCFDEGDESTVPGAVSTAFIKGSTFQQIRKSGIQEFSGLLYDKLAETTYYSNTQVTLNQKNFYSLLTPEDCEDLLCLWLYSKYGYICIPSTNKTATPLYECILINPQDGEHIYIQVKKGQTNLDANAYAELKGDVWLLTTEGEVKNLENYKDRIFQANPIELYEFAMSDESTNILSSSIKTWVEFLTDQDNKRLRGGVKGIMFDTNQRYSGSDENDMINNNRVSAYGSPKRYIKSFKKDDYVLYYSKGKGIIAAGRITSTEVKECESGLFHDVDIQIKPKYKEGTREPVAISAKEIKEVLSKGFFFASTMKTPFLSRADSERLINALIKKQEKA